MIVCARSRSMRYPSAVAVLLSVPAALGNNGYVLSFTGKHQLAGTRVTSLNASDPAIAAMQTGFTLMAWARFHDLTPNVFQPTIQIGLSSDGVRAAELGRARTRSRWSPPLFFGVI